MKSMLIPVAILTFSPLIGFAVEEPKSEPTQLVNLRVSWQLALSNATTPLNLKYREALLRMRKDFTRAGNLKDALAVDAEIKALDARNSSNTLGENPEEQFTIEGEWKVTQGGVIMIRRFKGDNLIDHTGIMRPWTREKNKIYIQWGSTGWEKLDIDPKRPDVMEGINQRDIKVTYTRIK